IRVNFTHPPSLPAPLPKSAGSTLCANPLRARLAATSQKIAHFTHDLQDSLFQCRREWHPDLHAVGKHEHPVRESFAVDILDQDALRPKLHDVRRLRMAGP